MNIYLSNRQPIEASSGKSRSSLAPQQKTKERKSASEEINGNATKHTAQKRRIKTPNASGVIGSNPTDDTTPAISLDNDERFNNGANYVAITGQPSIAFRVQELAAQVGFDQPRRIFDGLAPSKPPHKSNKDWILGSTTIKRGYIHQEIQDMMSANGFSQYIIDGATTTSSSDLQCECFDRSLLGQLHKSSSQFIVPMNASHKYT